MALKFSSWVKDVLALFDSPAGTEKVCVVTAAGTPGYVPISALLGGGGGGAYGGATDPNGAVTADGPAVYVQTKVSPTGNPGLWLKPTGSSGNTGWVEVITAD